MARPIKEGLNYFPLDVDIFDDPKLLFIAEKYGEKGELITIKLMCWIYRNGYYCEWNDETAMIFAKKNFSNIKASLCLDVVNELLKRGFFNEAIFKRFKILTSKAIQERWQSIMITSKRKSRVNSFHSLVNSEETIVSSEETHLKQEESTQSKVKESKVVIYYKGEREFLEDWKKAREKLEGLKTNIKKLTFEESQNFKQLQEEFSIEQFQDAIVGLFKQKDIFPAVKLRPTHFLRDRNIEKYLDCKVNNKQLFKAKTGSL